MVRTERTGINTLPASESESFRRKEGREEEGDEEESCFSGYKLPTRGPGCELRAVALPISLWLHNTDGMGSLFERAFLAHFQFNNLTRSLCHQQMNAPYSHCHLNPLCNAYNYITALLAKEIGREGRKRESPLKFSLRVTTCKEKERAPWTPRRATLSLVTERVSG